MANETSNDTEHEQIFSMLPWYVNQTLEREQRVSVSRHVDQCSECQSEVEFLISLNRTVQESTESHHHSRGDVEANLASVMSRIDSDAGQSDRAESLLAQLKGALEKVLAFPATFSHVQWGATAVAGVLVAVLSIQWYSGVSTDQYSVLSSSGSEDASIRLTIEVMAASDFDQVQSVVQSAFQGIGQEIDFESGSDGDYVVTLKDTVGVVELNEMIVKLEGEALIERVELLP